MKTIDYINSLIKERDEFKELCKKHVETIHSMKREMTKLNNKNQKQEKKILKLENESFNIKMKAELDKVKNELSELKIKYNAVVNENMEMKRVFEDVDSIYDSDC